MKEEIKITVRVTAAERNEIKRRAEAANKSVNRYLIDTSLNSAPRNDRQLSTLMSGLCSLELMVQRASDLQSLKREIRQWRWEMLQLMEG